MQKNGNGPVLDGACSVCSGSLTPSLPLHLTKTNPSISASLFISSLCLNNVSEVTYTLYHLKLEFCDVAIICIFIDEETRT